MARSLIWGIGWGSLDLESTTWESSSKSTACITWITTCWTIRWMHNQIIFNDAFGNPTDIPIRSIYIL